MVRIMAIYHHVITRGLRTTWHLSPYHNMECDHAIAWGCVPHGHSWPSLAIGIVRIMTFYHHAITWSVTMPQHGIAHRMAIHYRDTA